MSVRFIPRARLPDAAWLENVDPPVAGLWHIGEPLENLEPRVAIVGARDATAYGLDVARTLGADLGSRGIVVVSGMARGIDTQAHRGALSAGRTIAVLAGGPDVAYPRSSKHVHAEIAARGAILSENPPGSENRKHEFVRRNRIIVAISSAVVIVQADRVRSGAMKTAEFAAAIGRPVLAVPGDIRSHLSSGPHDLLRHGASVCADATDVLEAIGLARTEDDVRVPYVPPHLPTDERRILEAVIAGPGTAGQIVKRAKLDDARGARALSSLELAGLVRRDAIGCYVSA
jgi:DNA processing protein